LISAGYFGGTKPRYTQPQLCSLSLWQLCLERDLGGGGNRLINSTGHFISRLKKRQSFDLELDLGTSVVGAVILEKLTSGTNLASRRNIGKKKLTANGLQ